MSSPPSGFWDQIKKLAGVEEDATAISAPASSEPRAATPEEVERFRGLLFHALPPDLHIEYYSAFMERVQGEGSGLIEKSPEQLAAFYDYITQVIKRSLNDDEKEKLKVRLHEDIDLKKKFDAGVAPKAQAEDERQIDLDLVRAAEMEPESLPAILAAGADPMAAESRALRRAFGDLNLEAVRLLLRHGAEIYDLLSLNLDYELFDAMRQRREEAVAERLRLDPAAKVRQLTADDEHFTYWDRTWEQFRAPLGTVCAVARALRKDWATVRRLLTGRMPKGFAGLVPLPNGIGLFSDLREHTYDAETVGIRYIYKFFVFLYKDIAAASLPEPARHYALESSFPGAYFRCCFVPSGHVNYGALEYIEPPESFVAWAVEREQDSPPSLS